MASAREKVFIMAPPRLTSRIRTMRAVEINSNNGNSFETVSFLTLKGLITAAMPTKRRTLMMLLPMTLPIRMSVLPLMRELKETASSGAPVPKATIVRPMRSFDTLKLDATEEAPSTSQSAPLINRIKPTMSNNICSTISIMVMIITYFAVIT